MGQIFSSFITIIMGIAVAAMTPFKIYATLKFKFRVKYTKIPWCVI